jgi:hypothetical protein
MQIPHFDPALFEGEGLTEDGHFFMWDGVPASIWWLGSAGLHSETQIDLTRTLVVRVDQAGRLNRRKYPGETRLAAQVYLEIYKPDHDPAERYLSRALFDTTELEDQEDKALIPTVEILLAGLEVFFREGLYRVETLHD